MGEVADITIPYAPRPLQRVLHDELDEYRFGVAVCHRRFGKTVLAINQLIKRAVTHTREFPPPRFAYVMPYLKQGKDVVWNYIKHYTSPIPGVDYNESDLSVTFPTGAYLRVYGADNEEALRGPYLDGVVLDEYGSMSATVLSQVIRPMLSDYAGWAFFIGTPNGRNQFYELIHGTKDGKWAGAKQEPGWFFREYRASETGVLPQAELDDAKRLMTQDEYDQEYECSFEASVKGAVYAIQMAAVRAEGRITRVPFDPRLPVDTAWDLGMDDSTAIWLVQSVAGGEVRFVAYYENRSQPLSHYVGILKDVQARHGFTYGEHFLPHDVEVKELGTGVSRLETLRELGLFSAVVVPRTVSVYDDVNAVRMLLPRCYFNTPSCDRGIDALKNYRWKEPSENQTGRTLPVHDWASHGADALRTFACAPARKPTLLKEWTDRNRDRDEDDWRYHKGRYKVASVGRRGGW